MTEQDITRLDADDVARLENILADTGATPLTRRSVITKAATGAIAAGVLGPVASAAARGRHHRGGHGGDSIRTIIDTAVTAEALAVTYLTGLIQNASATGVTKFIDVLKAANAAEYEHYNALRKLGARPLTKKFWAPNDFFKSGSVFPTIETAETLFVDAYLIATTAFARRGQADLARYAGEILGVEAEHRALARFAQGKLPNNVAFESYEIRSIGGIVRALEGAGVGFGQRGSKPGAFYEFKTPPSSALVPISNRRPS